MAQISSQTPFDLDLGLQGTHVLVTGGCGLIGQQVVHAFLAAGSNVTVLDTSTNPPFPPNEPSLLVLQGSITDDLDEPFQRAEEEFGTVECCIALAGLDLSVLPQPDSICDMDPSTWQDVFHTNVHGTFMTCRRWLRGIRAAAGDAVKARALRNVGLVIVGSEAGRFGVRTQAAYAAGKAAVQVGLLRSLAVDVPRIWGDARVNAVAPGPVDTERFRDECARFGEEWRWGECEATWVWRVPLARPVPIEDVARTILFLASERYSGSVHGQLIPIDNGKKGGIAWTQSELAKRRGQ